MSHADVATPSAEYERMLELWRLPRTLMGGTRAMRKAGPLYLPQEDAESDVAYNTRLSRSILFNAYRKTVHNMTGKVFAKPITLGEDMPQRLVEFAEDVDLSGRNLDVFGFDVFRDALQTGVSHILVDMPPAVEGATRRDEIVAGRRPYTVHLKAENIIGWKSDTIAGVETLTQLRIREVISEADGEWHEKDIEQIRVFDRGTEGANATWRIFRKEEDAGKDAQWVLWDEGTTSLQEITLATVYFNRTGFMIGEPPLEDLADLNVAHWQSQSDQRNILHVARVPILFASGVQDDEKLVVGANAMIRASHPDAKMSFVEHGGAAIGAGRDDLKELEFQMQAMGLELLIPKPGNQTATARAMDQAIMHAPLQLMANALKDGLEQAFGFMAQYAGEGEDAGGEIGVNTDFGVSMRDAADITALIEARKIHEISDETFWKELKRRGVLMDDFDPDEERERLENEGPALGMIGREDEDDALAA